MISLSLSGFSQPWDNGSSVSLGGARLMWVVSDRDIWRLMCWILIRLSAGEACMKITHRTAQLSFLLINYMEITETIYSCILMSVQETWKEWKRDVVDVCVLRKCVSQIEVLWWFFQQQGRAVHEKDREMCDIYRQIQIAAYSVTKRQKLKNNSTNRRRPALPELHYVTLHYIILHYHYTSRLHACTHTHTH